MTLDTAFHPVQIAPAAKSHAPLALGCWTFGKDQWTGKEDENLTEAMAAALACGISHFDTAAGYGNGHSEKLIGKFLRGRRDAIFLATKADTHEMSTARMLALVEESLARLQTDYVDLFYIHWPRKGKDMRPLMEGLETARQQGLVRAVGVSNFSVEQMVQVQEVGTINAHQLCYNLLWRGAEQEIIPYCRKHNIAVVTYSSLAHGILTGKFPRELHIPAGDHRTEILLFQPHVWREIYPVVETLKALASETQRPLAHLAVQWGLRQAGITSALVGARDAAQARQNAEALAGGIADGIFERMTAASNELLQRIPNTGNVYLYYP